MKRFAGFLLALLFAAVLFCSCSSGGASLAPSESYRISDGKQMAGVPDLSDDPYESRYPADSSLSDSGEKMVYSVSLTLETTAFDDSISVLQSVARDFGGYVEYSNVTGNTRYYSDGSTAVIQRTAQYRIAVPADSLDSAVSRIRSIGNLTSEVSNADNVTSQYTDLSARLESLNVQEERLLELMKTSDNIESLIVLEDKLADVTYQKESYQRQLDNLERKIAYSVITVRMDEVSGYTPTATVTRTFGERLGDAFRDGWSGFVSGFEDFLVWFAESLPGILLFVAFILVLIFLIRFLIRKFNNPRKPASVSAPVQAAADRKTASEGNQTERE